MLRLSVDDGGEKWVGLAKNKLLQLKQFMLEHKLQVLTRWFQVSSTDLIFVNSLLVGGLTLDTIRITASGLLGGFLVIPHIVTPDDEELEADRAFIPVKLNAIRDYAIAADPITVYAFHKGKSTFTAADFTSKSGYLTGETGTVPGGQALTGHSGVFRHTYDVLGVSQSQYLRVAASGLYPMDTLTVLTGGALPNDVGGFYAARDGRSAVTFDEDGVGGWELSTLEIDFSAVTQVAYDTENFTSFGDVTTRTTTHQVMATDGTNDTFVSDGTTTGTQDIAFPISYAFNGTALVSNDVRDVLSASDVFNRLTATTGAGAVTAYSATESRSTTRTATLQLANGVEKSHTVLSDVVTLSGAGTTTSGGVPGPTGSIAFSRTVTVGTILPLYSDAAVPVLIYSLDEITRVTTTTGSSVIDFSVTATTSDADTTRSRIIALVGTAETVLKDTTDDDPEAVPSAPTASVTSFSVGGGIPGTVDTDNTAVAPYAGHPYFKANRTVTTDVQFAAKNSQAYLGSITDGDTHYVFGHKADLSALKLATVNLVLAQNSGDATLLAALATAQANVATYDALLANPGSMAIIAAFLFGGDMALAIAYVTAIRDGYSAEVAALEAEIAALPPFEPVTDATDYDWWFEEIRVV